MDCPPPQKFGVQRIFTLLSFFTVGVPAGSKTPPCSGMPHHALLPAAKIWDILRRVSMDGFCLSVLTTVALLETVCFSHGKLNHALVRFVPYNSNRNLFICFFGLCNSACFSPICDQFCLFWLSAVGLTVAFQWWILEKQQFALGFLGFLWFSLLNQILFLNEEDWKYYIL